MTMQDDMDGRDIYEALADDQATALLRRERLRNGRQDELTGDMTVAALPTVYRSTTFRSALEASWAATLDSLSIAWEYEPELITLPSGAKYLPDFRLPEIGTWLEAKGTGVPRVEKAIEFGKSLACACPRVRGIKRCFCRWPGGELVLIGNPPAPVNPFADEDDSWSDWNYRAALRSARRHAGHLSWTSTRGTRTWLAECPDCRHVTWFDLPRCRACRGPLAGAQGYHSGSPAFDFIRISGTAIDDEDDEAADPAA